MYRFVLMLIFSSFILLTSFSQECDCESNFLWTKKTFEENDAGFTYAIEQKGEDTYVSHTEEYLSKVKKISDKTECAETIYDWLLFFRKGHIGIVNLHQSDIKNESSDAEIINQFKDWDAISIDENDFKTYLDTKAEINIEGIWVSGDYRVAIKNIKGEFVGLILEGDGKFWVKNQVKMRIDTKLNHATYYMSNHSPREFDEVNIIENVILEMGFITFERVYPKVEKSDDLKRYSKLINIEKPFVEKISENTILLRIPSFSHSEKKDIDKVIKKNEKLILSTKNLIIDLRNNGGGSDASYQHILPLIYTNPIRTVGVKLYSTELNNQRMLDFMKDPNFSKEDKKWAEESYEVLKNHLGEFIDLDDDAVSISEFDKVYEYPKNVGVIINKGNASTTEQFLLAAKQSKKVKLFGATTMGVLDVSNMYFVNSPCDDFKLGYSLSISMRIPEMTIDDKGIQPDYYIDSTIPQYKWIDFVLKIL